MAELGMKVTVNRGLYWFGAKMAGKFDFKRVLANARQLF
jgi:hypothetical protein